ncbi:hypothetical protein [Ferruginivarius sediminum]|uniref:Uncharacterized protein n=1 Tax=Ferruginivarius sediminum TaxID=2661937 RepID=A0A369TFN0_9PROT|nr:hypothetical protein [Ferruginivarius sediminum]RDD63404.1 hypothetical protein DRB17_02875 [Ferruginivarius sediminum]
MIGRLIALVVLVAAVLVFLWGYQSDYEGTFDRTREAIGFDAGPGEGDPTTPVPDYEARGERIGGPNRH